MTDFSGYLQPTLGPAGPFPDPNAGEPKPPVISPLTYPPINFDPVTAVPTIVPFERVRTFVAALGVDPTDATNTGEDQSGDAVAGASVSVFAPLGPVSTYPGVLQPELAGDWFEKWLVFPGRLDLGNILSTQVRTLEIMNTSRRTPRTWQAFINNTTGGVSATNLPALPRVFAGLESFILDIQIDTIGPPTIDGTLDFDVDLDPPDVLAIPITGLRIQIFQFRPQTPINETLEFKTDIIAHNNGTEQRINVREAPRQRIDFIVRLDDVRDRDAIHAILYDWQSRVFGVPIWFEARPLQAPLAIDDTTVFVDTANVDFRVGGLVTIYDSNFAFETLEIAAINPNDLELTVGISQAFDGFDTLVIPTRTAYVKPVLGDALYPIGPTDFQFEWTTLDNIDLADTAAFDTYQGVGQTAAKVFINRLNFLAGATVAEGIRRRVERIDHQTGPFIQFSPWPKGRPSQNYGFEAKSLAETWEFRQLAHALRGSQVSFYLGTGRRDFKAVLDILDLATSIDFEFFGFDEFVQGVTPRSDIRILRTDGTSSKHQITGSSVVNDLVERIQVTPAITPALPVAEIDRIEYLTLVRIENDEVRFIHQRPGETRVEFPVTGLPG